MNQMSVLIMVTYEANSKRPKIVGLLNCDSLPKVCDVVATWNRCHKNPDYHANNYIPMVITNWDELKED